MRRLWPGLPWRPLPRPLAPMADETIGSYLARLAHANRLDPDALRTHILGNSSRSAALPAPVLAMLAGQPERSLRHAIPQLRTAAQQTGRRTRNRPGSDAPTRPACKLCAATRGHTGMQPRCHSLSHGAVCLKHCRWLGNGIDPSGGQLDLTGQPVIVNANLAHRRFARRNDFRVADDAYRLAHDVCHIWGRRMDRQEQFTELMGSLRPGRRQFATVDPAANAARYPQIVAVTRLLLTPGWQTIADREWDRPEHVLSDLWRAASPNRYPGRGHEPRPGQPLITIMSDDAYRTKRAA